MTLGQNIQAARKNRGMSQEALAEQVGVSRQALGKWEKDAALPGVDNLQALAGALGVGVDALLGGAGPAPENGGPAVTLEALRGLLEARDACEKRRRRAWGAAAAAAAALLLCGVLAAAFQYDRQVRALQESQTVLQAQFSRTQQELSARIEELQAAVRQGESTVLDWSWTPLEAVHKDLQGAWVTVDVAVTPRTASDGMEAQLLLTHQGGRYDGASEWVALTRRADGAWHTADGVILTIGETAGLSVQWESAAGTTVQETLGEVVCNEEAFRPAFRWIEDTALSYGYRTRQQDGRTMLTLTSYPVEIELDRPGWMQVQSVEMELRLDGQTAAKIALERTGDESETTDRVCEGWRGNFLDGENEQGWPYAGGQAEMVVRVTDQNGQLWTDTRALAEKT